MICDKIDDCTSIIQSAMNNGVVPNMLRYAYLKAMELHTMKFDEIGDEASMISKIADAMIKKWCIEGKMIPIATCNDRTQKFYQQFLYGDKNIDNKYRKIDFDNFIKKEDYEFNDTTSFNVYDYEYEED